MMAVEIEHWDGTACDEGRPKCQHCEDNDIECFYEDVPLRERDTTAIIEKLDTMGKDIRKVLQMQDIQTRRLEVLQKFFHWADWSHWDQLPLTNRDAKQ